MRNHLTSRSPDAWEDLAEAALAAARRGDTRQALGLLHGGIEAARGTGERRGEVIAMNCAALVHSIRGDYWASLAGSIDAFFLARTEHDRLGMARAMATLAGALCLMTPLDNEIGMLFSALKVSEVEGDLRLQARVHSLLGIVLGDIQRFDEAEVHFDMAMVLAACDKADFDRWRVVANQANLLRKRAQAAGGRGAPDECREYCRRGLEIIGPVEEHCRDHGKQSICIDAMAITGLIHLQDGDDVAAAQKLGAAWQLAVGRKHRAVLPFLGLQIGRLEMNAGQAGSAEATVTEALREAAVYRPSPKAAALCELMAELRLRRGDERGAAHWRSDAIKAGGEFDALKREARRQMARVTQSLAERVC